jgi:hypothetical protein
MTSRKSESFPYPEEHLGTHTLSQEHLSRKSPKLPVGV